jgi:chromosome segregation ATPase
MGAKQSISVPSVEETSDLKPCPSSPESDSTTCDDLHQLREENVSLKAREAKAVASWEACIEAARKQAADSAAELETARQQEAARLDVANASIKKLQQELDGKVQENSGLSSHVAQLKKQLAVADNALSASKQEFSVAKSALQENAQLLTKQLQAKEQENSALSFRVAQLQEQLLVADNALAASKQEVSVAKSALQDNVQNLKEQLQAKAQELSIATSTVEDAVVDRNVVKQQLQAKTQAHQEIIKELSVAKSAGEETHILREQLQAQASTIADLQEKLSGSRQELADAQASVANSTRQLNDLLLKPEAASSDMSFIKDQLQAKIQELAECEERRRSLQSSFEAVSDEAKVVKEQLQAKTQEVDASRAAEAEANRLLNEIRSRPQDLLEPKDGAQAQPAAASVAAKADDSMNQLLVEEMDRLQNENRDLKAKHKVFDKFRQLKKISWEEIESLGAADSKAANASAKSKGATKRSTASVDGTAKKQRN